MNKIIAFMYLNLKYFKYQYPKSPFIIYKSLLKSQYLSKQTIASYQLKELNLLLKNAKSTSTYYEKILSKIDLPLYSLNDYQKYIPFINKELILKNHNSLKTKYFTNRYPYSTSGSTGIPLTGNISGIAAAYRKADKMRFHSWWGIKYYDKSLFIWGKKNAKRNEGKLISKLKAKLRNIYRINVFDLNSESIIKYYKEIELYKPAFIYGYKSGILQFAELLYNNNLTFNSFKLKVVITTSEVLLNEERKFIENVLNAKVANEYGSAEAGLFAYECPEGSMHISEELVYIYERNNEAYVTELRNDAMPLINYFNNDRITISDKQCKCGRTSRIIEKVEGRVDDYIMKPNGSKTSQYIFYYIVKEINDMDSENSIKKYKVIQKDNNFTWLIERDKNYNKEIEIYILERMKKEIGDDIRVDFKIVENIPREKSGKLRFFIREK